MIANLLDPTLVSALGWTLLHTLWQGAAFALVLALLLIALRSYSAQARYVVSAGLLAGLFLTVGATFYLQWSGSRTFEPHGSAAAPISGVGTPTLDSPAAPSTAGDGLPTDVSPDNTPIFTAGFVDVALANFRNYYARHLPLLVTLWLVGVLCLQLRFLGQLAFVQRLRHHGTSVFPAHYQTRIRELEEKLRIRKRVRYLLSARAEGPMVVGWLKPAVLFPRALLAQLTDSQVYAVLAHELAHVRRDDFAVNLLQSVLTNVFFFHPGVWWMSARVDDEREHCCDDLAVAATGQALPYAKTLLSVSELALGQSTAVATPPLAMALTGKPSRRKRSGFAARLKRLFTPSAGVGTYKEGFATACILFGVLTMSVVLTGQTSRGDTPVDETSVVADTLPDGTVQVYKSSRELERALEAVGGEAEGLDGLDGLDALDDPGPNDFVVVNRTDSTVAPPPPPPPPAATSPAEPQAPVAPQAPPDVTALFEAIGEGDYTAAERALDAGAPVDGYSDKAGGEGWTPLLLAASENEAPIATLLISRGADINLAVQGWTPLIEAADEGSLDVLELLLEEGAEYNYHAGPDMPTALTMAASEGHRECLLSLLRSGADVNGFGESLPPLLVAAEEDEMEMLRLLLDRGADPNVTDREGRTALMYAADEGLRGPAALLVSRGADPGIRDREGRTALVHAYSEDNEELTGFLALITDRGSDSLATDVHVDIDTDADVDVDEGMIERQVERAMENFEHSQRNREHAERDAEREQSDPHRELNESLRRQKEAMREQSKSIRMQTERQRELENEERNEARNEQANEARARARSAENMARHLAEMEEKYGINGVDSLALTVAATGNRRELEGLLAMGAKPNFSIAKTAPEVQAPGAAPVEGWTAAHAAIAAGQLRVLNSLLDAGWTPDQDILPYQLSLKLAEANGHDTMLQFLKAQ